MTAAIRLKRKARGERPYFFADPNVDKVIAMVMGLAGEVAVMRDRLDTLERLLERTGALQRADMESFTPDAVTVAERAAWREAFLGEVLRIVEIEVEALAHGDQERYDSAIRLVEEAAAPRAKPRQKPAGTRRKAVTKKTAKQVAPKKPARAAKPSSARAKKPATAAPRPAARGAKQKAAARRPAAPAARSRARR